MGTKKIDNFMLTLRKVDIPLQQKMPPPQKKKEFKLKTSFQFFSF
jgi:hypothetical protein